LASTEHERVSWFDLGDEGVVCESSEVYNTVKSFSMEWR
jgi:hypothetical protein